MAKPKIAVFSGPRSTVANSPTLVTSNKGRLTGERVLPGRFDHLIAQRLHVSLEKYLYAKRTLYPGVNAR